MSYLDANGVHTYYEEHGAGDPMLLLHGGLADADLPSPSVTEKPELVNRLVLDFLAAEGPATTMMPLRRA